MSNKPLIVMARRAAVAVAATAALAGCATSTTGSAICCISRGTAPVRVMVCH